MAHLYTCTAFYAEIGKKNWLVNYIKEGLLINNTIYSIIYTALEAELVLLNLIGYRLNTIAIKTKLQVVFGKL